VPEREEKTNTILMWACKPPIPIKICFRRAHQSVANGTIEIQTATMDIADYLEQGGQTGGYRELWRLLRTPFKETGDTDELID
jgi:hypothetical protein